MTITAVTENDVEIAVVNCSEILKQIYSLEYFIYESNKGNSIFFLDNEKQALDKLSR